MSRFSRELKDFVAGVSAGQKIVDNVREGNEKSQERQKRMAIADEQLSAARHVNSPEQRALGVDVKRAAINASNASTGLRNAQAGYWNTAAQPVQPAAPINVTVPEIPGLAGGGAVPSHDEMMAAARAMGSHMTKPMEAIATKDKKELQRSKKALPSYEDGGLVEDDDDDGTFDAGITAAEQEVLAGAGGAYAQATPAQPRAAVTPTMPAPRAPRTPSLAQRRSAAAPRDQVMEVENAVKAAYQKKYPNLSPSYLKTLTLGSVYKHFYDQGDMQAAERARASMAQAYFMESDRYGAVARAAAEGGNADAAAKAMTQAYAAIPSGMSFHVTKKGENYEYTFSDEKSGDDITKGIWSPKQLLAKAMQMSEDGAEALVLGSAKAKKAAKGAKEPTLRDLEGVRKGIDTEFSRTVEGDEAGTKVYTLDKGSEDATANVATQIRVDNPRLSPRDAAYAAHMLSQSGGKLPNVVTTGEDGSRTIQLDDGRPVKISRDAWLQAAASKQKGRFADMSTRMEEAGTKLVKEREAGVRDAAREKVVSKKRDLKSERAQALRTDRARMAERPDAVQDVPKQAKYENDEE